MRCITSDDADLIRTFTLSLKMKNFQKTINYFMEKYEQNPDEKNAFHFGLCMSVYILVETNDSDKPKHQFAMNEAFAKCLEYKDDWWLVRYLRSEINDGIPEEAIEAYKFPAFEIVAPEEDRKLLIGQQRASEATFSYFLCPYIARVRTAIRNGNIDEAREIYKSGLEDIPVKRSPVELPYLVRPFYDTIVYLRKLKMIDFAEDIKTNGSMIFPASPNIRMA